MDAFEIMEAFAEGRVNPGDTLTPTGMPIDRYIERLIQIVPRSGLLPERTRRLRLGQYNRGKQCYVDLSSKGYVGVGPLSPLAPSMVEGIQSRKIHDIPVYMGKPCTVFVVHLPWLLSSGCDEEYILQAWPGQASGPRKSVYDGKPVLVAGKVAMIESGSAPYTFIMQDGDERMRVECSGNRTSSDLKLWAVLEVESRLREEEKRQLLAGGLVRNYRLHADCFHIGGQSIVFF